VTSRTPNTAALLLCVLLAGPARGEAPTAAGLLEDGIYQYSVAEFERSITLLKRASELTDDPALLGKIHLYLGVNLGVMGKRRPAGAQFRRALTLAPELTLESGKFKSRVVRLFEKVRAGLKGRLNVTCPVAGATVHLDGKPVGPAPYNGRLVVGAYQVEVRGPDGVVLLSERAVVRNEAETRLEARPKPTPAKPMPPPVTPVPPPPAAPVTPPGPEKKGGRLWTWIAAGAAVAAGAAGLGLGLSARSDYDDYESIEWDDQRIAELEDRINGKSLGANICFAAAGALAVTSVVLFFVEGRSTERQAARWPTITAGAGALGIEGTF